MGGMAVIVTGLGSCIAIDVVRALRADSSIRIIGCDADEWALRQMAPLVDAHVRVPRADDDAVSFFATLEQLICEESATCVFLCTDAEVEGYATESPKLSCPVAGPSPELSAVLSDKAATYKAVDEPELFPWTLPISNEADIDTAFSTLGSPLWLRARVGSGARRAIELDSAEEGKAWLKYWRLRGCADSSWLIHEFLPGAILNWSGLYHDGTLVAGAAMQRMRYLLAESTMTGISGQTAHGMTVDARVYEEVSDLAIRKLSAVPQGIYSVDLRLDVQGRPRITEISARLSGRPALLAAAGTNLPLAAVRLFAKQPVGDAITEPRLGVRMHRQVDVEPLLT
tara:strand:+ start:14070 stop:15092 length:1023 start_codon:yes stop_codon:yes gene_type:complete